MMYKTVLKCLDFFIITECHRKFHLDLEHIYAQVVD